MTVAKDYPPDALAPDGQVWWLVETHPGKRQRFGGFPRLAAWLYFNKEVGDTFSLREIRHAIGRDDEANTDEHLNRRVRDLRKFGWKIPSKQEDSSLEASEYRVVAKGWQPGHGPKPQSSGQVSQRNRALVFRRDGSRCTVCGVGAGEVYQDGSGSLAVMTIGHRIAQEMGGTDDLDNLRTECKRCNEPLRAEGGLPDTYDEIYAEARTLPAQDKQRLLTWLQSGERTRSKLDAVYDRARDLGMDEKQRLVKQLRQTLNG